MEVMEDNEKRQVGTTVLYGLKRKSGHYGRQHLKYLRFLLGDFKQWDSFEDILDEQLTEIDGIRRGW